MLPTQRAKSLIYKAYYNMKSATELYADNTKSTGVINALKKRYDRQTTEELKSDLLTLGAQTAKLSEFRYRLLAVSMSLSDRGIAPRWQGIFDASHVAEQHRSRKHDGIVIDLYWLSKEFPKHKTSIRRWQPIFTNKFDITLASSIAGRKKKLSFIVSNLSLSVFKQLGCIVLTGNGAKSLRDRSYRAREGMRERKNQTTQANTLSNEEILSYRALVVYCAKMADCKPTKTAQVYKWMTGDIRSRQVMAQSIKRLSIKPFSD